MMKNNEIILNNGNEMERIDLDNPVTIYEYGEEVLAEYRQLKDRLPGAITNDPVLEYQFAEPIKVIDDFNRALNGEEVNKTRSNLKKSKFASGICNVLNRISRGNIDLLNVNDHSAEEYIRYLDAVKETTLNMSLEKENLENDTIELIDFKNYVTDVCNRLGYTIEQGFVKIDELEKNLANIEDLDERKSKAALLELAKERVTSLKTSETLMKTVIGQISLALQIAIEQRIKYDEFIQVTAPTISLYARLAVRIKQDRKRLEHFGEVKRTINDTIITSARTLNSNVEGVIELSSDSLITSETLAQSVSDFKKGADMIVKFQNDKSRIRSSVLNSLSEIDSIFDSYSNDLTKAQIAEYQLDEPHKTKSYGTLNARY